MGTKNIYFALICTLLLAQTSQVKAKRLEDNELSNIVRSDSLSSFELPEVSEFQLTDDELVKMIKSATQDAETNAYARSEIMENSNEQSMDSFLPLSRDPRSVFHHLTASTCSEEDESLDTHKDCKKCIEKYRECKKGFKKCDNGFKACDLNYKILMESYTMLKKKCQYCKENEHDNCDEKLKKCQEKIEKIEKDLDKCEEKLDKCKKEPNDGDDKNCSEDLKNCEKEKKDIEKNFETCDDKLEDLKCEEEKCKENIKNLNEDYKICKKSLDNCDDEREKCKDMLSVLDLKLHKCRINEEDCNGDLLNCKTEIEACIKKSDSCQVDKVKLQSQFSQCSLSLSVCDTNLQCCIKDQKQCEDLLIDCKKDKEACLKREQTCLDLLKNCDPTCCASLIICNNDFAACKAENKNLMDSLKICNDKLKELLENQDDLEALCLKGYPDPLPLDNFVEVGGILYYFPGDNKNYYDAYEYCKSLGNSALPPPDVTLVNTIKAKFEAKGIAVTGSRIIVDSTKPLSELGGQCVYVKEGANDLDSQVCSTNAKYFCAVQKSCNIFFDI